MMIHLRVLHKIKSLLIKLPCFRFIRETADTQTPITFDHWFDQKVRGLNYGPYWPVHSSSCVVGWKNILAGIETSPGYMPGCYIQAIGKIRIGDYTQVAPSVAIISANHQLEDNRQHDMQEVNIGKYCWLGFGSAILPGVTLGDFTIVGAGAVVTKSFPEGHVVVAGNPAKVIKELDPDKCVHHTSNFEYHGYIAHSEFEAFRKAHLNL